jgi:hypothetical protein
MIEIQFLYFEDCPSHEDALERLQDVIRDEGMEAEVAVMKVETEEQAQNLRFTGSPTIRMNGEDIVPPAEDARFGLACRAYTLEDGRISPLPSRDMIRNGLRAAVNRRS